MKEYTGIKKTKPTKGNPIKERDFESLQLMSRQNLKPEPDFYDLQKRDIVSSKPANPITNSNRVLQQLISVIANIRTEESCCN